MNLSLFLSLVQNAAFAVVNLHRVSYIDNLIFLSETRKRFRLMLSSIRCPPPPSRNDFFGIWNISETIRDSDFKIFHKVALDSLYISTENDIINYFRPETNRIKNV